MNIARLRRSKAFTLIELIVVIVILGILVAIGAFAYTQLIDGARKDAAEKLAHQVGKTVQGVSAMEQKPAGELLNDNLWVGDVPADGSNGTVVIEDNATVDNKVDDFLEVTKDNHTYKVTFGATSGAAYKVAE